MTEISQQAHLHDVMLVHLGRRRIDVHDAFVAARIPEAGGVLDEIIADGDNHIGLFHHHRRVIPGQ